MFSSTPLNTFSICLSNSSRSVIISTRALGLNSRIHFVSHAIIRLLPLPCVCQMIPPSRLRIFSWAALTPKYWFGRQSFFCPRSNTIKSCRISISLFLFNSSIIFLSSRLSVVAAKLRMGFVISSRCVSVEFNSSLTSFHFR